MVSYFGAILGFNERVALVFGTDFGCLALGKNIHKLLGYFVSLHGAV
jgi:hypothetical protein